MLVSVENQLQSVADVCPQSDHGLVSLCVCMCFYVCVWFCVYNCVFHNVQGCN